MRISFTLSLDPLSGLKSTECWCGPGSGCPAGVGDPEEDLDDGAPSPENAEEGPGTDMVRTLNKEQAG